MIVEAGGRGLTATAQGPELHARCPAPPEGKRVPSMVILPVGGFLIRNLRRLQEYEDIVKLRMGLDTVLLVTSPALIQEVLVTKQRDFVKGRFLQNTKKVFGEGLLTSEADFHHRQRRLIQPAFNHERISAYAETMMENEERVTGSWTDGLVVDVHEEMTRLTMSIIAKCLFDRDVWSSARTMSEDLTNVIEYFEVLSSPVARLLEALPSARKYHRSVARVDEFVYRMIEERRAMPADAGDLMSTLLAARDRDGSAMADSQVRDEVLITFAAGHETTSNALSWTWYLLSQNPAVEAKLHEEVDAVLGDGRPAPDDVPRLGYATRVLTESMRLYPPAWILVRQAVNDVSLGGYLVPRGSSLVVSQYVAHHDPRLFADPEAFEPDRWTDAMRAALPRFAYFPFGGGARSCIGEPFAWMEGVLLLASISRKWSMARLGGRKVEMLPRITLRPKGGLQMRLTRR
ncbi:MAG: cytochrome P450 [Nitrososphaerota archaeon]|nr:cytochrome P450 [Nitrososphaerota archaeon]MDG6978923.1 cytochrome P450 [Nitrososphaerota archaeon]